MIALHLVSLSSLEISSTTSFDLKLSYPRTDCLTGKSRVKKNIFSEGSTLTTGNKREDIDDDVSRLRYKTLSRHAVCSCCLFVFRKKILFMLRK